MIIDLDKGEFYYGQDDNNNSVNKRNKKNLDISKEYVMDMKMTKLKIQHSIKQLKIDIGV